MTLEELEREHIKLVSTKSKKTRSKPPPSPRHPPSAPSTSNSIATTSRRVAPVHPNRPLRLNIAFSPRWANRSNPLVMDITGKWNGWPPPLPEKTMALLCANFTC